MNCTFGIVNHGGFEERYLVTDRFCYYTGQVTSSSAGQSVSPVFFKQVSVIIVRMNDNTQGELVDPLSPKCLVTREVSHFWQSLDKPAGYRHLSIGISIIL